MKPIKTLNLIFLLIAHLIKPTLSLTADGVALLSLKSAISQSPPGDNSTTTTNQSPFSDWNENDTTPCRWTGISCMNITTSESNPRVVGIAIAGKSLTGYIPSELGSLFYLRRLNLHTNNLYGSIPTQLFNATFLHSIFLYGNNLSGNLPPSICTLPSLQNLDLSKNSLFGPLPDNLNNCKTLQRMILSNNKFSGQIPAGIWPELDNLVQLDLSSNNFSGPIPNDMGELRSLSTTLNLSFNQLSGPIPRSLGNLPVTVSFDFRNNNLSGEIPQTGSFSNQVPTAFLNNPLLCGFPLLQQTCDGSNNNNNNNNNNNDNNNPTPSTQTRGNPSGLSAGVIILISIADTIGVALVGMVAVYLYWKKKDDQNGCSCTGSTKLGGGDNDVEQLTPKLCGLCHVKKDSSEAGEEEKGRQGELVAIDKGFNFELDELLRASAYVLGKSGLGIVYKVVLGNGVPVVVRRLGEGGGGGGSGEEMEEERQRYKEFVGEVQAIGKVKHPNIVRLRAYYWANDEKLLISDFISNGNLASALRGRSNQPSSSISWSTRLRIAKGTARGLAYLHECSPRKYVHGDIKPTNILLDNEFKPYISDFGLNRLISLTGSNPSSSCGFIGGALPYLKPVQPERSNNYRATEARVPGTRPTQKWDVYSFGVVLLELLTGKSPELSPSTSTSVEVPDLVKWVRKGFEEQNPLSDMIDPVLVNELHARKEVLAVFHIALACTEGDPEVRPRMKTVSENLDRIGT